MVRKFDLQKSFVQIEGWELKSARIYTSISCKEQMIVREFIKRVLLESSRSRRAHTRSLTGGRINTKIEMWNLAESLITDPPTAFFTMTHIQKVGINPSSDFDTPLALYSYPVTEETVDMLMGVFQPEEQTPEETETLSESGYYRTLPFVSDAPYITFFRLKQEGVFYTSSGMDYQKYSEAVSSLQSFIKRYAPRSSGKIFSKAEEYARKFHKLGQSGGSDIDNLSIIWTLTRELSLILTSGKFADAVKSTVSERSMVVWRKLLLESGINAVVDDAGAGLIHVNEKVQASIFDMSIVEIIQQFENRTDAATGLPGRKRADSLDTTRPNKKYLSSIPHEYLEIPAEVAEKISDLERLANLGQNTVENLDPAKFRDIFYRLKVHEKKTGSRSKLLDQMLKDTIDIILSPATSNTEDALRMFLELASSRVDLDSSYNDLISRSLLAIVNKLGPNPAEKERIIVMSPVRGTENKKYSFLSKNGDLIRAYANMILESTKHEDPKVLLQRVIERPYGSMSYMPAVSFELINRLWPASGGNLVYRDLRKIEVNLRSLEEAIKRYKKVKTELV
jgi:hypothetical protein